MQKGKFSLFSLKMLICSENAMNDVEKFLFDKDSNVSNWLNFNYTDFTTINNVKDTTECII
jgi:hypothetical protein